MNEEVEELSAKVKSTKEDLAKTKIILGTLIIWLQKEISQQGANDLLARLDLE
tara:strand:+ start:617 stop:775 length:159 start_codon:yes stop_codon:yes gene_type:complete